MFKRYLLTAAITAALAACGGGGGSHHGGGEAGGEVGGGGGGGGGDNAGLTVSGVASAPAGSIALLRQQSLFEVALNAFISPAAAAIIGLDPVGNATIELIRVDNDGNQVGDVLATATTSSTGEYSLRLPRDVNLAGNLVLRIRGNSEEMRAQVVDQTVNITPVSEFVLRKFIAAGADLTKVDSRAVVTLSGKIDQFDIAATSDLTSLLEKLDAEIGGFVENEVGLITSGTVDATVINGDYWGVGYSLGMHDGDGDGFGAYAIDLWNTAFSMDGKANGAVTVEHLGEESAYGSLWGTDGAGFDLNYEVDIDTDSETLSATFGSDNVLTVQGVFEEEVEEDDDLGWRWLPSTFRFHKVPDRGIFFQLSQEASVRYGLTANNEIDPEDRLGDEITRALEVVFKKPTNLTNADLDGTFGRVYLGTNISAVGTIEVETETNLVEFDGNTGTLELDTISGHRIYRETSGLVDYVGYSNAGAGPMPYSVGPDGDILSIGGENIDGFVNDTAELIAMTDATGASNYSAEMSTTWMVKLPSSAPAVSGKQYRLLLLNTRLVGKSIVLGHTRGNSTITFTSNSAATARIESGALVKTALEADIEAIRNEAMELEASVTIGANGAATLELEDADKGVYRLEGYLNSTGSYGIFTTSYTPEGQDPNALGLAVLIATDAAAD